MLRSIRQFIEQRIDPCKGGAADVAHRLRLATAALMIEMMRVDDAIEAAERDKVVEALRRKFALGEDETATLIELAEEEMRAATDYFQFTSLINKHFDQAQKITVVNYLWEVAYADGRVDMYEDHLVRKISELLYVPHADFIAAKLRAAQAAKR